MTIANARREEKARRKEAHRQASAREALRNMGIDEPLPGPEEAFASGIIFETTLLSDVSEESPADSRFVFPPAAASSRSSSAEGAKSESGGNGWWRKSRTVREHIDVTKARMRVDPRPIDASCACYTCRNFSRAYLHHLFKAKESLGGTLVDSVFTSSSFIPSFLSFGEAD
jgi:hypothetical protein